VYIVEVVLVPPSAGAVPWPPACLVQDVFWPLTRREDRLEHLRARTGSTDIAVVLFVGSPDGQQAVRSARSLCERVSRTAPLLAGWTVAHCALFDPSA
jgi:hypothetical protein